MAQKLSELLEKLSEKAKQLEHDLEQSKTRSKEEIQTWEEKARMNAQRSKEEFQERSQALGGEIKSNWDKMKENFDNGVTKMKRGFREAKYKLEAENASEVADWAEQDAEASVYFALDALADAEESIIEAMKARQKADQY